MSGKAVLDALIVLNESALAVEQLTNIFNVARASGDLPTEEEIEALEEQNMTFIANERARLAELEALEP